MCIIGRLQPSRVQKDNIKQNKKCSQYRSRTLLALYYTSVALGDTATSTFHFIIFRSFHRRSPSHSTIQHAKVSPRCHTIITNNILRRKYTFTYGKKKLTCRYRNFLLCVTVCFSYMPRIGPKKLDASVSNT